MAKLKYISAAQAKPQITTITIAGTWLANDTVTLKVAEKEVTYTAGASPTPTSVAAGLQALCAASSDPEFREVKTWVANSGVITATGTDGIPITIAVSKSSVSGTAVAATAQAATGPYFWDNVDNWDINAVPATNDEVYIESTDSIIKYGLPTSLTLSKLYVRLGSLGLPDRADGGYTEYRPKRPTITCTDVQIGSDVGKGPALCRLNLSTAAAVVAVWGSATRQDYAPVELLTNSASASINVLTGQVAIAPSGSDTSTVGTVRVGSNGSCVIGAGVTVTSVVSVGNCLCWASPTNLTVDGGTTTIAGSAAVSGTTIVSDGTLVHKSSGTLAAVTLGPGQLDCSQDLRTKTITSLTVKKGGQYKEPFGTVTITTFVKGSDTELLTAS